MESVPPIRRRSFLGTGKINEVPAETVGKMGPGKTRLFHGGKYGKLDGSLPCGKSNMASWIFSS
jgi:hypothetical protein